MNKLGSWITPYEVNKEFLGGNVWQHAINKGIVYGTSPSKGLMISLDVPVVAPGTENQDPSPFIKTVELYKIKLLWVSDLTCGIIFGIQIIFFTIRT